MFFFQSPQIFRLNEIGLHILGVPRCFCGGQLKGKGKGLAHRDISLHVRDIQKFEQQAPIAGEVGIPMKKTCQILDPLRKMIQL